MVHEKDDNVLGRCITVEGSNNKKLLLAIYNIHLMCAPEGNSEFCFPESLNVSRDEVEERKITFTIIVFHDMTINRKFYSVNKTFASSK